jgi:hypothetical protein
VVLKSKTNILKRGLQEVPIEHLFLASYQKFKNFSVLVIVFENRSRTAEKLVLKSEIGFSQ